MKKILYPGIVFSFLVLLPSCKYAHGDGPDVATPRHSKEEKTQNKNPRKSNWVETSHRERIGRKDINKTVNDDFQVFPHRTKCRSEDVRRQSSPFFWR